MYILLNKINYFKIKYEIVIKSKKDKTQYKLNEFPIHNIQQTTGQHLNKEKI